MEIAILNKFQQTWSEREVRLENAREDEIMLCMAEADKERQMARDNARRQRLELCKRQLPSANTHEGVQTINRNLEATLSAINKSSEESLRRLHEAHDKERKDHYKQYQDGMRARKFMNTSDTTLMSPISATPTPTPRLPTPVDPQNDPASPTQHPISTANPSPASVGHADRICSLPRCTSADAAPATVAEALVPQSESELCLRSITFDEVYQNGEAEQ
ncbi:hypothetical protein F4808DRAFT_198333 [Astrocystis sublimbata]|nr:hypothetical protein F4808DRAFT_198333 [Astrocystis sublimbata]